MLPLDGADSSSARAYRLIFRAMTVSLNFVPQPPEHPFAKEYFNLTLYLQDAAGEPVCGSSVGVALNLHFEDRSPAPAGLLETEGRGELRIAKNGACACRARVTGPSLDHENRSFLLRASATVDGVRVEAWSTPMRVMRYRLEIEGGGTLDADEPAKRSSKGEAAIWYKDEGGREKCIELVVRLYDGRGALVTGRSARLKCVLRYAETGIPVTDQKVLKVWAEGSGVGALATPLEIRRGVCKIRARIEDVSKNHQGQSFRIEVAPDAAASPTDCDVAPAVTKAVAVR